MPECGAWPDSCGQRSLAGEGTVSEIVDVAVSDLLLDQANPRLGDTPASQQDVYTELAKHEGRYLLNLAEDIVKHGLDPTNLPTVVPTGDRHKRYRVVEGNRRVLALKALETPSIVSHVFKGAELKRINRLSARYMEDPLITIKCVLFEEADASLHWIFLRHTGLNDGVGLHGWGADEQDRFQARHSGVRKPAGQILDFVEGYGALSDEAKRSNLKILTNIERLLVGRAARDALGIDVVDGEVVSLFSMQEVAKGLTHVVDDLKCKRANVKDVYHAEDREMYIKAIPRARLPKGKKLPEAVRLSDLAAGKSTPAPKPPRRRQPRPKLERTAIIPSTSALNISTPRINKIYNELLTLNVESYPNAGAVLLRVFLELTTDHGLDVDGVMPEQKRRNTPLAGRMKALADHYSNANRISDQLRKAVHSIADRGQGPINASTMTMNQYVHNPHVHPTSAELRAAWDQMEPFLEKVWP